MSRVKQQRDDKRIEEILRREWGNAAAQGREPDLVHLARLTGLRDVEVDKRLRRMGWRKK